MIVEIWREEKISGFPVRFTAGSQPAYLNEEGVLAPIEESPTVKAINFYETGAFKGAAYRGPCYVVQFEDSPARRIVPAKEVIDILWAVPQKDPVVATPALED